MKVDISSGIVLTTDERAGFRKAIADLHAETDAATKRLAVLTALHVLHAGLPALGLLGPEGVALGAILDMVVPKTESE